jgi:hypothetical protein
MRNEAVRVDPGHGIIFEGEIIRGGDDVYVFSASEVDVEMPLEWVLTSAEI